MKVKLVLDDVTDAARAGLLGPVAATLDYSLTIEVEDMAEAEKIVADLKADLRGMRVHIEAPA